MPRLGLKKLGELAADWAWTCHLDGDDRPFRNLNRPQRRRIAKALRRAAAKRK